mgnify:CR=1 FL=1
MDARDLRGLFLTIEGPDGAGKTTQARLLVERFGPRFPILYTREPGGTAIGEHIREILLSPTHREMSPLTEMLLFAASRAQFVAEVVLPALRSGRIVLSERFVDASIAYQGYGRGIDLEVVRRVNEIATGGLRPDLTILVDIDPEVGLQRIQKAGRRTAGDRLEREDLAFHRKVREGFLAIAREEPDRVVIVGGDRSVAEVHGEIALLVERFLAERGWKG